MSKRNLSAAIIVALAALLGGILAACAYQKAEVLSALVAPTPTLREEQIVATLVAEKVATIWAERTAMAVEGMVQTLVAEKVATLRAGFTPTPTSTATQTPIPFPTPTPTPRRLELGLCLNPWFHPPTLAQLQELGVGWVRFVVRQSELTELGDVLAQYGEVGMKVLLVVNQETLPMMEGDLWKYGEDFSEEFLRLVQTYEERVSAWEIWNEPEDNRRFKYLSEPDYLHLLELCYDKVKAVSPSCTILATGYPASVNMQKDGSGKVLGRRLRCDGYVVHPYGCQVNGFPEHYGYLAEVSIRNAYIESGVPIWVTEFGAPLKDFRPLQGKAEEHQARYLAEAVGVFRSLGFVQAAFYFAWDDSNDTDNGARYGLMSFNGRERPAFEVFKSLARGR